MDAGVFRKLHRTKCWASQSMFLFSCPSTIPLSCGKTSFMEESYRKKLGNLGRAPAAWRSYSFAFSLRSLSKPAFSSVLNLKKFQGTINTDHTLRERKIQECTALHFYLVSSCSDRHLLLQIKGWGCSRRWRATNSN